MNAPTGKIEPATNTAIWDALSKTDPAHTKGFKRGGGFTGTAIKPIWIVKRLTEQFGSAGSGWGMDKPEFQVVSGDNREVLVFCTVSGWYLSPSTGEKCTVYGVGGDKVVTHIKANQQYNRPERWENDDEAFKKAFTDAVGNAFKFLGVGADVHMGMFDDSKYVRAMEQEFAGGHSQGDGQGASSPQQPDKWTEESKLYPNKSKLHKGLTQLERELMGCGDSEMVYGLCSTEEWREFARVAEKHAPHYLRGGDPAPPEFEGLLNIAERMVREFDGATATNMAALART